MGATIVRTSENQTKNLLKMQWLPRLGTQGTRKQGCKACIHIREYILFPEYCIEDDITKWKLQQLKEVKLRILRDDAKCP